VEKMQLDEIMKMEKEKKKEKPEYKIPGIDDKPIEYPGCEEKQEEIGKWYPRMPEKKKEKPEYQKL
jgi:hypothetical protein